MASASEQAEANGAATPAVRLSRVRKRFGLMEVLRGVDLELARGECLSMFGPNGAGKSTLVRIIATQWRPTGGSGEVFGFDLARQAAEIRRRIGVVFHQSFLRSELTLDENLRFYSSLYGVDGSDKIPALLERFGLAHRRRDRVSTFSQGMTKRANLIRSLLHDPELWILDEPFSGLDPDGCDVLCEAIRTYRDRGGTVILVTHQTQLGEALATQVVRIAAGRVAGDGAEGAA